MPKPKAITAAHERANKARRVKYRKDPVYRAETKKRFRAYYREEKEVKLKRNCEPNIDRLEEIGKKRFVFCADGERRDLACLSMKEMCEALGGYYLDNVRDWIYRGMFPPPIHAAPNDATGKGRMSVYTVSEARALLVVFSDQQKEKAYFTAADKPTTNALFAQVLLARKNEGIGNHAPK